MKKILLYALILAMGCNMTSCVKEMMSYEGIEGVYFGVRYGQESTIPDQLPYYSFSVIKFILERDNTYTLRLMIMTTGEAKNYDRTVIVAPDPDNTTATQDVDFEPIVTSATIKAGELHTYIPVTLHRTSRMNNEEVTVGIKLLPSNDFELVFEIFDQPTNLLTAFNPPYPIEKQFNASKHQIRVDNKITKPAQWQGGAYNNNPPDENGPLGYYSDTKIRLIMELFGVPYADFMDATTMPNSRMVELGSRLAEYLWGKYKQRAPVLDEDGRLMFAFGVPWTSYLGVPWDGLFNPDWL